MNASKKSGMVNFDEKVYLNKVIGNLGSSNQVFIKFRLSNCTEEGGGILINVSPHTKGKTSCSVYHIHLHYQHHLCRNTYLHSVCPFSWFHHLSCKDYHVRTLGIASLVYQNTQDRRDSLDRNHTFHHHLHLFVVLGICFGSFSNSIPHKVSVQSIGSTLQSDPSSYSSICDG